MIETKDYIIYFQNANGTFTIIEHETNEVSTIKYDELSKFRYRYYLFVGYEANDNSLIQFHDDFERWNDELKTEGINVKCYIDFYKAIVFTYARWSNQQFKNNNFVNHETIDYIEHEWMDACYNAGIMFCNAPNNPIQSYGYDFNFYYPSILASKELLIPTKRGHTVHLDKIPKRKNLEVGYYKVKITCENNNFKKLFSFSKKHVYTNVSLYWALSHKHKYDIKFELFEDDNAYLYNKENCIDGWSLFSTWYNKLRRLKTKFPNNKLVKHLGSSFWGNICKFNTVNVRKDDYEKLDYYNEDDYESYDHKIYDGRDYHILLNKKQPYKYNIRVKPFMTSLARNTVAKIAKKSIKHVIRINTDNVTFDKEMNFDDIEYLEPETKTTGLIKWKNFKFYDKVDSN